jgi:AraC family transcriptional regulator, regulatory protein of adaptative response / methylated-DNA-[protein]-cysteine methyltransferase
MRVARPSGRSHTAGMETMRVSERHSDTAGTDEMRWTAVSARDARADGTFVYAVRSTGIYCRPSCAARRPRRDRVEFFDGPSDARRAGYRACRRCRPDAPAAGDPWTERIRRACAYLSRTAGHPSLEKLAAHVGGSPYHLQRNFKRLVGITPREYAEACRLKAVKNGLRHASDVTSAIFDAGFGSSSRFYERAVPKLGMSPSAYRNGGAGITIRYAIVDSPLGRLLVAGTERGVCVVAMGASDAQLERELVREYRSAKIVRDGAALEPWVKQLLEHLKGTRPHLDLPIDVQVTAFQWRVWQHLASIPYGETRSYAEIAAAIGNRGAARAVAKACATNPVAIVIPCHRVVTSSGGIGGYRWGVWRKRAILAKERQSGKRD